MFTAYILPSPIPFTPIHILLHANTPLHLASSFPNQSSQSASLYHLITPQAPLSSIPRSTSRPPRLYRWICFWEGGRGGRQSQGEPLTTALGLIKFIFSRGTGVDTYWRLCCPIGSTDCSPNFDGRNRLSSSSCPCQPVSFIHIHSIFPS